MALADPDDSLRFRARTVFVKLMESGGAEAQDIQFATEVFKEIDADGGGALEPAELKSMLEKISGEKLADNVLVALMIAIDEDGDGEIISGKRGRAACEQVLCVSRPHVQLVAVAPPAKLPSRLRPPSRVHRMVD